MTLIKGFLFGVGFAIGLTIGNFIVSLIFKMLVFS